MAAAVDFDNVNIFFTHLNPTIAAEFCCDAHVRKMVVESTQLLANVYHMEGATIQPPPKVDGTPYAQSHWNHPCAKWAQEDLKHWIWLKMHAWALAREYEFRFGSEHSCMGALRYMDKNSPVWMQHKTFWDPPLAMPDEFKSRVASTVSSYRNYIRHGKTTLHVWTKRPPPVWLYANGDENKLKAVAEALLDACQLSCFDADDYRVELDRNGLADDRWNDAVEMANCIANGNDPVEGPADLQELAQTIFDKSKLELLSADPAKDKIAPEASRAEWQLIKWVATEFANGRDPLAHPADGNYRNARL